MAEVRWTQQAAEDIESIAEFITRDSVHYAGLFVRDILRALERRATFPKSGRIVPELNNPAVREIPLGNYRIIYRVGEDTMEVLAVCHGARLLDPDSVG